MPSTDELGDLIALEGVASTMAAARDGLDAVLRDRGRRTTTPGMTADALLIGAVASARLAGSATSIETLRAGGGDSLAVAAARLNAGLLALVPVIQRSPVQAFARLHTLAAAGSVDPELLGRPVGPDAAEQLQRLGALLLQPTSSPALAVAALAHAEIATTRPFHEANGLVARALERLLIVARGIDPASVLVPEAGHASRPQLYEQMLSEYATKSLEGRRDWLLYAAEAVTRSLAARPLTPS